MTSLICLLGCMLKLLFSITYTNHDYIYLLKRCRDSENKSGQKQFLFLFYLKIISLIYLFSAGLGHCCCMCFFFRRATSGGCPVAVVCVLHVCLLLSVSMGSRARFGLHSLHLVCSTVATPGSRAQWLRSCGTWV